MEIGRVRGSVTKKKEKTPDGKRARKNVRRLAINGGKKVKPGKGQADSTKGVEADRNGSEKGKVL